MKQKQYSQKKVLKKISLLVFMNPVLLLVLAISIFIPFYNLDKGYRQQESEETFSRRLGELQYSIIDIEAGYRGFILTGDTSYLGPLQNAELFLSSQHPDNLLTNQDVPEMYMKKYATIDSLVHLKIEYANYLIQINNIYGRDSATQVIAAGYGKYLMNNIRTQIHEITANDSDNIEALFKSRTRSDLIFYGALILFVLVDFLSSFFTNRFIRFENRRAKALHYKVKRINKKLLKKSAELTRSNDDLRQFAYIASHDLKEPLRNISGFIQLLKKHSGEKFDETANEYIAFALDHTKRLSYLISDLLTYSQLGKNNIHFEPVDLNEIMKMVRSNLSTYIGERRAVIRYESLPSVDFHSSLLIQILTSLVENGIKFNKSETPVIDVQAVQKDNKWVIGISDNGIGIETGHTSDIFGMFRRLHGRHDYEGNGIGLSICKRIADHYEESIWYEKNASGGTTFYFTVGCDQKEMLTANTENKAA